MGDPPYYAPICTPQLSGDLEGYDETSDRMAGLVGGYDGYLGMYSARGSDGFGITVCYWRSEEDIAAWRADLDHREAQDEGRDRFYSEYTVEVARVDRAIEFQRPD